MSRPLFFCVGAAIFWFFIVFVNILGKVDGFHCPKSRASIRWLLHVSVAPTGSDRISRYSPEKRRLRPSIRSSPNNRTVLIGLDDEGRQRPPNIANGMQRVSAPIITSADYKRTATSSTTRKYGYRSSYELSSILMMARQKKNANSIVDKLTVLCSSTDSTCTNSVKLNEYNLLLKELGDNGHLKECDRVLALMISKGVKPSIVTYSTLISKAGIWQKVGVAEKYFQQMLDAGISPDVPVYNCLANAYAKSEQPDEAFGLLPIMQGRNLQPNIITFNTLIDSCAHSGDIIRAERTLQLMSERGISPNARSYSSLIHTCCQAKDLNKAFQLLTKMKQENFEPTDVTLSLVLHGLGQSGDLQRAFDVLEAMKSKGIKPNVVTMSSLVYACGKHGQLDRAFSLYNEMSSDEDATQRPNSITCSALIDACLKSGDVDRAFTVIHYMRERQLPMTQVTYTSVITELTKLRKLDRILEVVSEPLSPVFDLPASSFEAAAAAAAYTSFGEKGLKRDREGTLKLDQFTRCLLDAGHTEMAEKLQRIQVEAEKMEQCLETLGARESLRQATAAAAAAAAPRKTRFSSQSLSETSALLSVALNSSTCLSSESVAQLVQNVLELPALGNFTESMFEEASRFLLNECGKAFRFRRTCTCVEINIEQQQRGLVNFSPALNATQASLMEEFIKDRKNSYSNVVDAYQWIKESKLVPCARIYNQLLRVVNDKSKKRERAGLEGMRDREGSQWQQRKQLKQDELFRLFLVFQEMREAEVHIDTATYNTLINACAAAGDLEKAIETVQAMQEEGILPNVITYTSLIKACRYNGAPGSVQLAEWYFREMQQKNNHFSRYIDANTYTYLQLMKTHMQAIENGLYGEGDTRRVWDLLEDLLKLKLNPSIHIWRECVAAALYDEDIHKALGILALVRQSNGGGIDFPMWQACIDFCSSRQQSLGQEELVLRAEISNKKT